MALVRGPCAWPFAHTCVPPQRIVSGVFRASSSSVSRGMEQVVRGMDVWWAQGGDGTFIVNVMGEECVRVVNGYCGRGEQGGGKAFLEGLAKAVTMVVRGMGKLSGGVESMVEKVCEVMKCVGTFVEAISVLGEGAGEVNLFARRLLDKFCTELEGDERFVSAVRYVHARASLTRAKPPQPQRAY